MGQTLTHGVYLPDEGERNCYSGLAANWQLLDGAVGTVAEHTTQIAGKAPLVHTHTVSDITDFPAYGTTAGTICEGNDSRLSDARTPVAHTHSKADITDLFNSANTWTANQTFKGNIQQYFDAASNTTPATNQFNVYNTVGSNSGVIVSQQTANRTTGQRDVSTRVYATDNTFNGYQLVKDANNNYSFIPIYPNTVALGTSSLQWKSVSSQTYYYNGTAWGLDQANEWTNFQRMKSNPTVWYLRNNTVTLGTAPSSNRYLGMFFEDVNGANLGYAAFQANRNGYNSIVFNITNSDGTNTYTGGFRCTASPTGAYSLFPEVDGCDLGLSTNKWKTFNGINPGALSLPKTENGRYSLTELSSIPGIGVDNWVLDGGKIVIDANYVITGWLYVCIACDTDGYVILQTGGYSYPNCFYKVTGTPIAGYASATIPIVEGIALALHLKGTSLVHARYYPAAGNV